MVTGMTGIMGYCHWITGVKGAVSRLLNFSRWIKKDPEVLIWGHDPPWSNPVKEGQSNNLSSSSFLLAAYTGELVR